MTPAVHGHDATPPSTCKGGPGDETLPFPSPARPAIRAALARRDARGALGARLVECGVEPSEELRREASRDVAIGRAELGERWRSGSSPQPRRTAGRRTSSVRRSDPASTNRVRNQLGAGRSCSDAGRYRATNAPPRLSAITATRTCTLTTELTSARFRRGRRPGVTRRRAVGSGSVVSQVEPGR